MDFIRNLEKKLNNNQSKKNLILKKWIGMLPFKLKKAHILTDQA